MHSEVFCKFVRNNTCAAAGRFYYAYYYFFTGLKHNRHAATER